MRSLLAALLLAALPGTAATYRADLVPAGPALETEDLAGEISITGADGLVAARVEGVNDAAGDPLDGEVVVQLRLRVNGARRRVVLPIVLDGGDGQAETSLGLAADDQVVVRDVRLRAPGRRTLALPGVVAADLPPPPPAECPAVLAQCEADLTECLADLETCDPTP